VTSTKTKFEDTSSHGDVQYAKQLTAGETPMTNESVWQKSSHRHNDQAAPTYTAEKMPFCC